MDELSGFELNRAITRAISSQVFGRLVEIGDMEGADAIYFANVSGKTFPLPDWAHDTHAALMLFRFVAVCRINRLLIDMSGHDVKVTMAAPYDSETFSSVSVTCTGATLAEAISRLVLHVLRENDQFEQA